MWTSGFRMSTFPHACRRPREPRCGGEAIRAKPGRLLFALSMIRRITAHHVVRTGGGGAISVTIIAVTRKRTALTPADSWLRHSPGPNLGPRRHPRAVKRRPVAPHRIQDAT